MNLKKAMAQFILYHKIILFFNQYHTFISRSTIRLFRLSLQYVYNLQVVDFALNFGGLLHIKYSISKACRYIPVTSPRFNKNSTDRPGQLTPRNSSFF